MHQCLSRHFCLVGTRSFSVIGSGNGAWEGRILSTTASSLPGRLPVYSLELTNNFVQLALNKCTSHDNEVMSAVIFSPIRITIFRLRMDVQRVSTNRCAISDSRDFFSGIIALPMNPQHPNAWAIYRLLKFYMDVSC
uniref:Secreted protein n=1 Tax=Mesocestoides corti TaxID=53468 RepID=A0A5K3G0M6_MESCO